MIDFNKQITLNELLNFCKKYDNYGKNELRANLYEGKSFFEHLIRVLYKIPLKRDDLDLINLDDDVSKEIDELFKDYK